MKKILSILLSLISVICIFVAFGGCSDNPTDQPDNEVNNGNNQTGGQENEVNNGNNQTGGQENEVDSGENQTDPPTIEVNGSFYTLKQAHDSEWINEDDLKSIACCYYDLYNFEENSYSGLYEEPTEELEEKIENEIKQAYLEQIVRDSKLSVEGVEIRKYYGVYSGNIVVSIYSQYLLIDPIIEEEFYIGGVLFKNFWQGDIRVYHI